MTRPKLLYLVTEDWYFVSHRLALAKAAEAEGYEVSVVTRVDKHGDEIRDAGLNLIPISFHRSGLNPIGETRFLAQLIAIYRKVRPDIVHHVAMKPVLYGSLAARVTKVKCVVNAIMGLGFVFSSESPKARVLRPLVRRALASALGHSNSRVIVQNEDDRGLLISGRLAPANQIELIRGSGVDLEAYPLQPLASGRPKVVLPARMLKDKGVLEFVEAARLLKRDGVDAEFVLAGAPDLLNPSSISDADIEGWVREGLVTYLGWRDDMAAVLASATIVCLPSYREGLPKALLEAAAIGRPIVTTNVPGCREVVRDGVNGWLVPSRDAPALAMALRQALADRARCQQFGIAGRNLVETSLSLRHVINQTLAVYRDFR